jgi:hypothetical protein
LLEDGVFMGGFLLGFDSMMLVGWAGKFLSTGPVRDAAHERNVEGGSFHGGGGEVVCQRRQWRGGGGGDGSASKILRKIFFSGFPHSTLQAILPLRVRSSASPCAR